MDEENTGATAVVVGVCVGVDAVVEEEAVEVLERHSYSNATTAGANDAY
jgi:hypothetical protein